MKPYPIFLIGLENRHCIVIGGGHEAEYKVKGLLDCGATVTVIHPTLTGKLDEWAENGCFTWLQRPYQTGDLRGAFLAIAERGAPSVNAAIWEEAESEGVLVNVIDDVSHCNFVAGSVVRQGPLTISISTSGAAPALAVRLRQEMEQRFGPEYAIFLNWMQELRPFMAETYPKFSERKDLWYKLVDADILDCIEAGDESAALRWVTEILGKEAAAFINKQDYDD